MEEPENQPNATNEPAETVDTSQPAEAGQASEPKRFKKVFIFARNVQENTNVPFAFPVNRPVTQRGYSPQPGCAQEYPQESRSQAPPPAPSPAQTPPASRPVKPPESSAPDSSPSPQASAAEIAASIPLNTPPVLAGPGPLDVKVTSSPIDGSSEGAGGPDGDSSLKSAAPPKLYVAAVKEKLSYMLSFQLKMNQLSKQLKDLMGKTARGSSGRKMLNLPKEE